MKERGEHKNKIIKMINIHELSPVIHGFTREETSRVVFLEAWVEFVIANAGD